MKYYKKIIEIQHDNDVVINNVGVCLEILGKREDAVKYYKRTNKINPKVKIYSDNMRLLER